MLTLDVTLLVQQVVTLTWNIFWSFFLSYVVLVRSNLCLPDEREASVFLNPSQLFVISSHYTACLTIINQLHERKRELKAHTS